MSALLRVADGLALPLDIATETIGVLAKKGAGKTYFGSVLAEEMLGHHLQVVVVDPTSAWWGLRSSADGKSAGLPIVIFGGDHADVPLTPDMGEVVADVVVADRISAVLDLGPFRKGEQVRFMTAFAERLYHRNREPLHLILDEADAYAPQTTRFSQKGASPGEGNAARLLGAIEDIVRRGRIRGLGITLITQRSAVLNKNVLTQLDALIVLQTTGPQDIDAIEEWIKRNASTEDKDRVLKSLPSLGKGEAWIWAPGLQLLQRFKTRLRKTFDSSATPKLGERRAAPTVIAKVDLEALRGKLATAIETAKADDPRALRARIRELEAAAAKTSHNMTEKTVVERVEVPVLTADHLGQLRTLVDGLDALCLRAHEGAELLGLAASQITAALDRVVNTRANQRGGLVSADATKTSPPSQLRPAVEARPGGRDSAEHAKTSPPARRDQRDPAVENDPPIGGGETKLLAALAGYKGGSASRIQLGMLAGYTSSGGTFQKYVSTLKSAGLLEVRGSQIVITLAGRSTVGTGAIPFDSERMIELWRSKVGGGERKLFDVLIEVYPEAISRAELGARSGYDAGGGTFQKYLSTLRSLSLIDLSRGSVRAADELFG